VPDGCGVGPTGSSGVEAATRSHLAVHYGELEGAPQGCCGEANDLASYTPPAAGFARRVVGQHELRRPDQRIWAVSFTGGGMHLHRRGARCPAAQPSTARVAAHHDGG
jgi:uncharacterized protein with LGFP repeats